MKKISKWIYDNGLFLLTLFLLAFIPLYPKLPLVDIKNTWVYIRAEDFIIFVVLVIYAYFLFKKKVSLVSPLTIPILAFWILGGLATIHGVMLIFPTVANIFPNVAFLSYLRHIEYLSVFFVAFAGMRRKEFLKAVIVTISIVFLVACFYGLGQKYASFPAFLTMNEEFAKGIPITLSALGRVPSTFAGHYDFAAYLVLTLPIFAALFFGFKNLLIKAFFAGSIILGLLLIFMTVSRVSFFAVVVSMVVVLFVLKRKLLLFSIPIVLILGIMLAASQSSLFARFGNTISEVDVLVNGETGAAIGNVEYVPVSYLYEKNVKLQRVDDDEKLGKAIMGDVEENATSGALVRLPLPYELLPADTLVPLVKASNISNGETLPQGTGYINLSLSPVKTRVGDFYYELSPNISTTDVINFHGNFLVKTASAYDLSFTTRTQGEWPHAVTAFTRNIFLGSGYGSVSLAIDNNYLRMLAEIGLLGTASFLLILVLFGIYVTKSYKYIESKVSKTFLVGVAAGIIGIALNAVLIDVFEASKVAFLMWILIGISMALILFESSKKINIKSELFSFAFSFWAVCVYVILLGMFLYTPIISQFFTLSDFTVFYHSISCGSLSMCVTPETVISYFLGKPLVDAPLVTFYFSVMYKFFWLNNVMYHILPIILTGIVSLVLFVLAKDILRVRLWSLAAALLFIFSAAGFYSTGRISDIGVIASTTCALLSVLLYLKSLQFNKPVLIFASLLLSVISLLFGTSGVVIPFLILIFATFYSKRSQLASINLWIVIAPVVLLAAARVVGVFIYSTENILSFIVLPWVMFSNMLVTFPGVVLGESIALSITQSLYSAPFMLQVILSIIMSVFVGVIFYVISVKKIVKHSSIHLVALLAFALFASMLPYALYRDVYAQSTYMPAVFLSMIVAFVFYKLYLYLKPNGIYIASGFTLVLLLTYSLFQLIQIQSVYREKNTSSDSVKKFLVSIDSLYDNSWKNGAVNFYFVNTPTDFLQSSNSQSSLESVLWLVIQNPELSTFIVSDELEARRQANITPNSYIFGFQEDKTVIKVPKVIPNKE